MDSQDSSLTHHLHHHQQPQFRGEHGPPRSMMMSAPPPPPPQQQQQQPNYAMPGSNNNNGGGVPGHGGGMMQQQQQQSRVFPFNSMVGAGPKAAAPPPDCSGGSSPRASGFSIEPAVAKKKRGRPRKYSPDGNIALGLSPSPVTPVSSVAVAASHPDSAVAATAAGATPSSDTQAKKIRGRPPGSIKKQLDALGSAGVGFTPHVITVNPGEDIAQKIMAFSQQGPRTVCILSANGAISNVTLRQPATCGGTVTLEGRFEIISLSGSFLLSESNGSRSRSGGLSVSLAGGDGKVVGGGVSGMLTAASPVQVVVGSFIADGKRPKQKQSSTPTPPPPPPPSNMLNFGGPGAAGASSPLSEGPSSESDEENSRSPPHHPHHGSLPYSNAGQPVQPMPMYANMGWPNSASKMLP